MNDQHAHAGYVGYTTGSYDSDPLFGALPGSYEEGQSGQYDSSQWETATHTEAGYAAYGTHSPQQAPNEPQYTQAQYATTGQWDASAWNDASGTGQYEAAAATFAYDTTGQYDTAGQWAPGTYDSGSYDASAWNSATATPDGLVPQQASGDHEFTQHAEYQPTETYAAYGSYGADGARETGNDAYGAHGANDPYGADTSHGSDDAYDTAHSFEAHQDADPGTDFAADYGQYDPEHGADPTATEVIGSGPESDHDALTQTMTAVPVVPSTAVTPSPVRRSGGSRGRRRTPAKRSALLTVAVPSACVMGVAGIAAASVSGLASGSETQDDKTNVTAADPASVKPVAANTAMDTQLAALSADARDFGDRASRTQERIDLKARQAAEKKKREEEAERREALRPKFMLPVKQDGLSAYYGQSGVNWMSLHTGIDFPVQYGTEVMAATDGTVRTQWNSAYGNMAIVTAADGTETWYCHLSSTKIRSGSVKAGDVIAYSGNSGNSTGPHLHFEVRPGGGAAIDPLPWMRSHGMDPT